MIETSQLQTLVAVAESKSFSKAADNLGVTQSAISQSIKNLEGRLGVKVFKRSGKLIVLTTHGERLYRFGSLFISGMKETLNDLQDNKEEMKGKVRIGTLTGIGKSWLAHQIVEYAHLNPDLKLSIRMGHQEELLFDFDNNLLDILVLPEDDLPVGGERQFLLEEKSTLVFPKDHKDFALTDNLSLADLLKLPIVLFDKDDHLFYKWCRSKFNNTPKKVNVCFTVNSHGNMLEAVYEGLGVAVVPNHVLNRSYFKDKISTLGGQFEITSGKLYIVHQKESEDILRIKKTIDHLLNHRETFMI